LQPFRIKQLCSVEVLPGSRFCDGFRFIPLRNKKFTGQSVTVILPGVKKGVEVELSLSLRDKQDVETKLIIPGTETKWLKAR